MTARLLIFLGLLLCPVCLFAQADPKAEVDERASDLEAELGKLRDSSPEAIQPMLELVDLYYAHGRVLGLIRVGNCFVINHSSHPRHAEVMAKLIDGLLANSRNEEIVNLSRQYLSRYPKGKQAARVEEVLAFTLDEMQNREEAAEAYYAVWKRQGNSQTGKQAGVRAIRLFSDLNRKEHYIRAGQIAEEMIQRLPADGFTALVAEQGFYWYRRASDWAAANRFASKVFQRKIPLRESAQLTFHHEMGENYSRLDQRSNAVESFRKALAVQENENSFYRMLHEMYNSQQFKSNQYRQAVEQYWKKFPASERRFDVRALLGHIYLREENSDQASKVFAELLPEDAYAHSAASHFVRSNGNEPKDWSESEKVLQDAIKKNPKHAGYLRYVLAFELYRDRVKDKNKAYRVAQDLVTQSPSNDHYTENAIRWLLSETEDQGQFNRLVDAIVRSQEKHFWMGYIGRGLEHWSNDARRRKETRERGDQVRDAYKKILESEFVNLWREANDRNDRKMEAACEKLLEDNRFNKLPDEQARWVANRLGHHYRYRGNNEQKARAIRPFGQLTKRFPKDYAAAVALLEVSADYGEPETAREAVLHFLSLEPESNQHSCWYRGLDVAKKLKDEQLAGRVLDYAKKSQQKHGLTLDYAAGIGDRLAEIGLEEEALKYWNERFLLNRNHHDSRECARRIAERLEEGQPRIEFFQKMLAEPSNYHGYYAFRLADEHRKQGDLDKFAQILAESRKLQLERPFRDWNMEESGLRSLVEHYRGREDYTEEQQRQLFKAIRDLEYGRPSAMALLAWLELPQEKPMQPMERLLEYQKASRWAWDSYYDFDRLMTFAQAAIARKDYAASATLLTGMLANISQVDENRKQKARERLGQSYARLGGVGLAIDENSPIAPLLRAALYLRLGDRRLAFETYMQNQDLFDQHRNEMPVDLVLFVAENHIAAGGDENHQRAEEILRGWIIKFSEAPEIEDSTKAKVQLLLGRNYYKSQRYDVSRAEYTTVINRYPNTDEAIEAEFGIGECFMAQKVYDQAEEIFNKLATSQNRDVVIRAEFLRGVLANRRGERDEAREIFRNVLEMVPSIELANQALFNLAEVYGAEQRYMDQLELLRTVGRLGRNSKRWHAPGQSLSIVVQDSDLGISRGHTKIPVLVKTAPGGDEELIYLYSGGAGKGLFRADLETQLGSVTARDGVLQVTGDDRIQCDYPEEFKAEFRNAPLADADIRIAADATFEAASSKIVDKEKETLSERLEREAREEEEADRRVSQQRPANQIKPGNIIYMRVQDPDRDLSDEADEVIVKLTASSGDQVQLRLQENGAHTGEFEGSANTGELPAGALASDTAIDHSPTMAIDRDPKTTWLSEPDGATPKWLSVDMKDLKNVSRVVVHTPNAEANTPLRGELQGSHDGRFWFRLGRNPPLDQVEPLPGEFGQMTQSVYSVDLRRFNNWKDVTELVKNRQPIQQTKVETLEWSLPEDSEDAERSFAILWKGKLVQPKSGAARFKLDGTRVALIIDGKPELPLGPSDRTVDVFLEAGSHEVVFVAAAQQAQQGVSATWAREDYRTDQVNLVPFRAKDFDLDQPEAVPAPLREEATLETTETTWAFDFAPLDLRHVRLRIDEYRGEAVAINHLEVSGPNGDQPYIPTEADVLALANNDVLEIAAGDEIVANYTDKFSQISGEDNQLLSVKMQATYFNAEVTPISYDYVRSGGGAIQSIRKQLMRIDPGERVVAEIVDYDHDQTAAPDQITFQVRVNDGQPITLTAQETGEYTGIFTKEIDTSLSAEEGKLQVKPGDRIYITYTDEQNTFPGHAIPRESVVYVAEPTEGFVRLVETRVIPPPEGSLAKPQMVYLDSDPEQEVSNLAFEAPLTIEVIDPDAAKDDRSKVFVDLETTDGAKVKVECVISSLFAPEVTGQDKLTQALEEGRFVGQIPLQLGSQHSPDVVPLTQDMPRNLIGGGVLPEEETQRGQTLVTRVLNLTGKDIVTSTYEDKLRPDEQPKPLTAKGRLIANGTLACVDREYKEEITELHVGEKLFLLITDADLDVSDQRDKAPVEITNTRGEQETILLEETLAHSGVFTGSVALKPEEKPTPGNWSPEANFLETYFGDTLNVKYLDQAASTETGTLELLLEIPVVIGTDGLVAAFSKTFNNEEIAVETQFHIAESYFELFKSHRKLGRTDEEQADLEAGRRVLREVMEDYPDPKYVPRIAYLLGQFAQELEQWDEAIHSYEMIVRQYSDSVLAPDAQFKLAQCYEEAGDFDNALEEYVTLAATYPESPLIANVMVRISEYFWKKEQYDVAAQVGEKFLEKFQGHEWAPRMAFRIGQCFYKAQEYKDAGSAFDRFAKIFPEDGLTADSLFWAGESYRMASDPQEAFRRYNRCHWEHPESEAAKYSRGRLALPEMQQQFEAAANVE